MGRLNDLLSNEVADTRTAADAAARGRSLTGLSNRHTDRLADGPEPIAGERVTAGANAMSRPGAATEVVAPVRRLPAVKGREPFGAHEQQLAWPIRPDYRGYWFSDTPGRVARAKRAGYQHVIDPDTRDPVSRITDRADGRGRASYLMEIPRQWYLEDMARQASQLAARLDDIRRGQAGPGAEENRYVPQQGITITGR